MSTANPGDRITEDELLKSLQEVEQKVEQPAAKPAEPKVEVVTLTKSMDDTVAEFGSENLKRAIDVSDVVAEMSTLLGIHVDRSLSTLEKSIHAAAARDVAVLAGLTALRKSIDANTEAMKALGDQPGVAASRRPVTATQEQILAKNIQGTERPPAQVSPAALRKSITDGLSRRLLATRAENPGEAHRIQQALVKFESTGQISDSDMASALAK